MLRESERKIDVILCNVDTGKRMSLNIGEGAKREDILYRAARAGLLGVRWYEHIVEEMPHREPELTLKDIGASDGSILHIRPLDFRKEYLAARGALERWEKRYTLRFQVPEEGIATIECVGSDQPEDIFRKLREQRFFSHSRRYLHCSYIIKGWPTIDRNALERPEYKMRIYDWTWLCDIDPEDGHCFVLQEECTSREKTVCLYGCPTAELPVREELTVCKIEVIDYA